MGRRRKWRLLFSHACLWGAAALCVLCREEWTLRACRNQQRLNAASMMRSAGLKGSQEQVAFVMCSPKAFALKTISAVPLQAHNFTFSQRCFLFPPHPSTLQPTHPPPYVLMSKSTLARVPWNYPRTLNGWRVRRPDSVGPARIIVFLQWLWEAAFFQLSPIRPESQASHPAKAQHRLQSPSKKIITDSKRRRLVVKQNS